MVDSIILWSTFDEQRPNKWIEIWYGTSLAHNHRPFELYHMVRRRDSTAAIKKHLIKNFKINKCVQNRIILINGTLKELFKLTENAALPYGSNRFFLLFLHSWANYRFLFESTSTKIKSSTGFKTHTHKIISQMALKLYKVPRVQ